MSGTQSSPSKSTDAGSESRAARRWLTPPEIARERGLRTAKILDWIRSGELLAVNLATSPHGLPRWKISAEALAAFDAARSNRASGSLVRTKAAADRRTRRAHSAGVEEFFP
ncbi:MAG: DNA-binding protein [Planctomycetota bacterium]|nr:MAG: DNA-binding protein [Planctomycetota bacterium]